MNTNILNNLTDNIILDTDSYKVSHYKFLEPNTESIYAYIEARIGAKYENIVAYGFQGFVKNYMLKPITQFMIDQAEYVMQKHGEPFNREGWEYILKEHNGYMPVIIKTPEEGTTIPVGCPYLTIENTDKNPLVSWVGPYLETKIMRTWAPIAVATQSNAIRKLILKYLEETGTPELIDYKMVDFGSRGVASFDDSAILGSAHLTSFRSTDNLLGIAYSVDVYNANDITGESIPASEHSVTTARGKEGELQFYLDIVDNLLGEGKMVSVVGDTYSLENMLDMLGTEIKPKLLAKGGTWVVRPDSGIPVEQVMFTLGKLDHYFGSTVNDKGYKVLHPSVRIIQGDGVNDITIEQILETMKNVGYSADNITFGSGGFLLQSPSRDTNRTAFKASSVVVDGVKKDIRKNPKTDPTKASKAGRVTTVLRDGKKICVVEENIEPNDIDLLTPLYKGGKLLREITFEQIRENVKNNK